MTQITQKVTVKMYMTLLGCSKRTAERYMSQDKRHYGVKSIYADQFAERYALDGGYVRACLGLPPIAAITRLTPP